jgi:hypothetical protein
LGISPNAGKFIFPAFGKRMWFIVAGNDIILQRANGPAKLLVLTSFTPQPNPPHLSGILRAII